MNKLVSAKEYLESFEGKGAFLVGSSGIWGGSRVVSVKITEKGAALLGVKKFEDDDVHFIYDSPVAKSLEVI